MRALVTGASGFIGGHLCKYLKQKGYWVRGVDWDYRKEWDTTDLDDFKLYDLRDEEYAFHAMEGGIDEVYALAADMGGMEFISANHIRIMQNNMRINMNTLRAAHYNNVKRYFYASSACIYPEFLQVNSDNVVPLKESDAFPANPQDAYGWEKLMTEVLCNYYRKMHGMNIRIARFHNIAGPYGTWRGGREKAPAAICRKVAVAKLLNRDYISVFGDGSAVRSYCYIDDCIYGIYQIMTGNHQNLTGYGINLGSDEAVSVNQLVDIVSHAANHNVIIRHTDGPLGVAGRNSDNTLIKETLGWCPSTKLEDWIPILYQWIYNQLVSMLQNIPQNKWEETITWIEKKEQNPR